MPVNSRFVGFVILLAATGFLLGGCGNGTAAVSGFIIVGFFFYPLYRFMVVPVEFPRNELIPLGIGVATGLIASILWACGLLLPRFSLQPWLAAFSVLFCVAFLLARKTLGRSHGERGGHPDGDLEPPGEANE